MASDLVMVGDPQAIRNAAGNPSGYRQEVRHLGLHEYKLIRAPDLYVLRSKVATQIAAWEARWARVTAKEEAEQDRNLSRMTAEAQTREAAKALDAARGLLAVSLRAQHKMPWEIEESVATFTFTETDRFPRVQFDRSGRPEAPRHEKLLAEPDATHWAPKLGLFDRLFSSRRERRIREARARYETARAVWTSQCKPILQRNRWADEDFVQATQAFEAAKAAFDAERAANTARLAELRSAYEAREPSAVATVAELILEASDYPDWMKRDIAAGYSKETSTLFLDWILPEPASLPSVAKVSYIATRNELKSHELSQSERSQLYDSVVYQIVLRSLHEIFSTDIDVIQSIVFNGWLSWVNPGTGVDETGCLVSLQVSRSEWLAIDLSRVDPKACFKQLKGLSATQLSAIAPVAPIARFNTEDRRFVDSYEVSARLAEGVNLAAIDWEDFEHLVREIFEREYAGGGGEVKVTRASADGGVDAVIFDPDPIRGGKIVVQAKRYTMPVPVSAVRDLYGTMLNEGAMKGILVTTSDYGPESYAFAKDKPITLLSGGNLLQLLEKQGQKARIDLMEARRLRDTA